MSIDNGLGAAREPVDHQFITASKRCAQNDVLQRGISKQMMIPLPPAHELACGSDWVVQRDGRGPAYACAWSFTGGARNRSPDKTARVGCLPGLPACSSVTLLPQWSAIRLLRCCPSTINTRLIMHHMTLFLDRPSYALPTRKTRVAVCVRGAALPETERALGPAVNEN